MRIGLLVSLGVFALPPAALAQNQSLLFFSQYNSTTTSGGATPGLLDNLRPFDLAMVTPGAGASAHPWVPGAAFSAMIGDPDADGQVAEFSGLPQASWGLGSPLVKWADKPFADPRKVYWTIREPISSPPTITVKDPTAAGGTHVVRVGDWVRIDDNGNAEFFIKREHFVAAIGMQTGNFVDGATSLCQAPDGSLYYSPAHAVSANGGVAGGHWVQDGLGGMIFAFDGAICTIPAAAITYDAKGNVQSVAADSARVVANEIGVGPNGQFSVRDMCKNSGALDNLGQATAITFMMVGLDIDPNGGTYIGWFGNSHPHFIFTFENTNSTCCGGLGSWCGTVFSTAPNGIGQDGSIAVINGVTMGDSVNPATGSWLGIQTGSGSASAPVIRGLSWVTPGYASVAPYGNATMQTSNDGLTALGGTVDLAVQAPFQFFPTGLIVSAGPAPGGAPTAVDLSFLVGGFSFYNLGGAIAVGTVVGDASGRTVLSFTQNNPALVGQSLIWQGASLTVAPPPGAALPVILTNPVVTQF